MPSERERRDYQTFVEEDRKEQEAIAARLEAPLKRKRLEERLNRTAQRLRNVKRFALREDDIYPYIPEYMFTKVFASEEELFEFNTVETREFYNEYSQKGWYPSEENIATLQAFFTKRGIMAISREMYASAFQLLTKAGLLEAPEDVAIVEEPIPSSAVLSEPRLENFDDLHRLPVGYQAPVAYRRESQQTYWGIDPLTGMERSYTNREVDLMDSQTYAKTFGVKTGVALTKANFDQNYRK